MIPISQRDRARELRAEPSLFEQEFWQTVRAGRMDGFKFRRQQAIGPYIADFVCLAEKLVVELDGGQHQESLAYDARRDAWLQAEGYRVLRVWNSDWIANQQGVLEALWNLLHETSQVPPPPSPQPLPPNGGGANPVQPEEKPPLPSPLGGEGPGERAGTGTAPKPKRRKSMSTLLKSGSTFAAVPPPPSPQPLPPNGGGASAVHSESSVCFPPLTASPPPAGGRGRGRGPNQAQRLNQSGEKA